MVPNQKSTLPFYDIRGPMVLHGFGFPGNHYLRGHFFDGSDKDTAEYNGRLGRGEITGASSSGCKPGQGATYLEVLRKLFPENVRDCVYY